MNKVLAVLAIWACTATAMAASSGSVAEIHGVIESFRQSIIKKDKALFVSLLAKPDIPWIGVVDGDYISRRTKDFPDYTIVRAPLGGSPIKFMEYIAGDPSPLEEKFQDIKIDTDGNIATVQFDYSFHADGVKTNWGKEAWQLVNTGSGWKINSVVWSVVMDPKLPPPARTEVAIAPKLLVDFPGSYEVKPGDRYVVSLEGDRLKVTHFQNAFALYALSPSKFFDKFEGGTFEFVRNGDGHVTRFNFEAPNKSIQAMRVQ